MSHSTSPYSINLNSVKSGALVEVEVGEGQAHSPSQAVHQLY